ncbi:hypothetical protein [Vibrio bivalvicida]|uniref:Uncharacterized protein n=1 Tax=Vibrio bivalvicida TaxID=1276888 RepID=A0ABV4MDG3_9VIBR
MKISYFFLLSSIFVIMSASYGSSEESMTSEALVIPDVRWSANEGVDPVLPPEFRYVRPNEETASSPYRFSIGENAVQQPERDMEIISPLNDIKGTPELNTPNQEIICIFGDDGCPVEECPGGFFIDDGNGNKTCIVLGG